MKTQVTYHRAENGGKYPTHKNTPEAKAATLARKQARALKYAPSESVR